MSKKHFIVIAAKIKGQIVTAQRYADEGNERGDAVVKAMTNLANDLARDFASFNGNFDRQRFLTACGL